MDSEHLAGCSSLTLDGLIPQLDNLLWNHENSYLYERESMSDSRDTQFKRFAAMLMNEIMDIRSIYVGNAHWREECQQLIARRAYDLVGHTLDHAPINDYECNVKLLWDIPDMTELPRNE